MSTASARYDPKFYGETRADAQQLIMRRSCKVLAHETGHMFGIQHCVWYLCLKNASNHIDEADERPLHLCPVYLSKLQWSVGFDVLHRYRRLLAFDSGAGFQDEAGWLEARIRGMHVVGSISLLCRATASQQLSAQRQAGSPKAIRQEAVRLTLAVLDRTRPSSGLVTACKCRCDKCKY